MKIKRKFDLFSLGLVLLFLGLFLVTWAANRYIHSTTEELANLSKELDFLTGLKTSLDNLEYSLREFLASPDDHKRAETNHAYEEFYRLVGKTRDFRLDEDELEMLRYLRENIDRFSGWLTSILYSERTEDREPYLESLRMYLFHEVGKRIEKHWDEDMKKIEEAKKRASLAQEKIIFLYLFSLVLLGVVVYLIRRTISRRIIKPLLSLSSSSHRIADGELDHHIKIETSDELSELADNFNRMADTLREKISSLESSFQREQKVVRELAILNEFIGYVTTELEFDIILRRFVERASDLLKADGGAILVHAPDGEELFVSTNETITQEFLEEVLRMKGERINSLIELEEASMAGEEARVISGGEVGNIIYIPVVSSTGMKGVLSIFSREANFSESDEDTLFAFAFQAFQSISFQRELARMATTDGLTGLHNHRMFQERLTEEILRAERYKRRLFLLLLDIDHFKLFNDTYGHQTGDEVLRIIASVIRGSVRKVDFAARYGGEEFVIILPETDCENAFRVAERIREKVERYVIDVGGHKTRLTVSIGISCFPQDAIQKEDLIRKADAALYLAKERGRNRVVLFSEIPVEKG